ncbi:solute carrier family 22 member 18 [Puma concolor]|uniref:Solute carrier family 22 member 18 n=1 Tax=Puma concolor TaxID=9696 RepID=A0A6P6H6K4_PUMCO|nr:solute carrier family 22 member 18 [Puma concolor]
MQGAGAPRRRGPYSREIGALGRPGVILLTYALVTLGLTCLFMRFSIMPYLTRRLGLDSVAFGHLQTTFGALQLLGGPVLGRPTLGTIVPFMPGTPAPWVPARLFHEFWFVAKEGIVLARLSWLETSSIAELGVPPATPLDPHSSTGLSAAGALGSGT